LLQIRERIVDGFMIKFLKAIPSSPQIREEIQKGFFFVHVPGGVDVLTIRRRKKLEMDVVWIRPLE